MLGKLRVSPFNITIIQVYAPTASYSDSDVDEFYRELQSLVDQTPNLVVQGDWNAKVGEDVDFATYDNLVLANTLGNHKPSRRWSWHSTDGTHHNQNDYILVKKRFRSGNKTDRTRTFPGQMLEATMTW